MVCIVTWESLVVGISSRRLTDMHFYWRNEAVSSNSDGQSALQLNRNQDWTYAKRNQSSFADLRRRAVYLFTGRPEVWFESFGANHPTWNGMIGAMKRSFLDREHDFMTLQEIQSRPQQRNENFEVY
jgi:hypothetical protein